MIEKCDDGSVDPSVPADRRGNMLTGTRIMLTGKP
jgi:hypothetical protein